MRPFIYPLRGEGGAKRGRKDARTAKIRNAMSSILRQTAREKENEHFVSLQHRALAAGAENLIGTTSSVLISPECATSRGIPLLIKGKQFHITQRGLKETSGFWYISKQPLR